MASTRDERRRLRTNQEHPRSTRIILNKIEENRNCSLELFAWSLLPCDCVFAFPQQSITNLLNRGQEDFLLGGEVIVEHWLCDRGSLCHLFDGSPLVTLQGENFDCRLNQLQAALRTGEAPSGFGDHIDILTYYRVSYICKPTGE